MAKDIKLWTKVCISCQIHSQIFPCPPHSHSFLHFSHIKVDLVDLLPPLSRTHLYPLTIIDRTVHWAEAVPLPSIFAIFEQKPFVQPGFPILASSHNHF
jgi:hypothetical protein